MSEVYFLKDFNALKTETKKRLMDVYPVNSEVLVKIHFGEPGNKFAFNPETVRPIIEAMKDLELKPVLIDTPVVYSSPRDSVDGYKKAVEQMGWNSLASFLISDNYLDVKTRDFTVEVCKELAEAENVLVLTHIKGHSCAGFGGAIKNLGMGGVSKKTKSLVHTLCKPRYVKECRGCGICVEFCPAKAIKMVNNKAEFDSGICWGCSICQIECPHQCLASKKAYFDDLLGQAAAAVIGRLPANSFYINMINNVVKFCDCEVDPGPVIAKDIGILFSSNPIAIDKASVDLVNEINKKDLFKEINHKDPLLQVKYAAEYLGQTMNYELIKS